MRPTFIHDNSLAAVGFTALLKSQHPAQWNGSAFIHVVSISMPCSKAQYEHMVSTPGYSAGACIVLESMPANPDRAKLRIKGGRICIVDARLSLPEMRRIARYITRYLNDAPNVLHPMRWQTMWEIPPSLVLRNTPQIWLRRYEQSTLRYLLGGYRMKTIAAITGLNVKTVSRYKYKLMHKLNVFSLAELHFRLCMEIHMVHSDVGNICKVSVIADEHLATFTETLPVNLQSCLTNQAAVELEAPIV